MKATGASVRPRTDEGKNNNMISGSWRRQPRPRPPKRRPQEQRGGDGLDSLCSLARPPGTKMLLLVKLLLVLVIVLLLTSLPTVQARKSGEGKKGHSRMHGHGRGQGHGHGQHGGSGLNQPTFTHAHLKNHTERVGSEVQFSCTVDHLGDYKVAWLHSDKGTLAVFPDVITQNQRIRVSYDNRATYHLKLTNIQEADAGRYICQINTGPVISISGSLSVVVPPDIVDDESSSDTLASEGMRVLLECRARGNPAPTISWVREDGKPIQVCKESKRILGVSGEAAGRRKPKDCKEVQVHYGNDLELSVVSRFDSAAYLCLANNGVPPTVSKRVRLYVDFPPTLWISHQLVGAEIGSMAEIECLTAAHPPSLNFWSRDKGQHYIMQEEGKYEFTEIVGKPSFYNILMKLRILNLTEADFGSYQCLAKNAQGKTSGEINLYEVPKPSTTTQAYNFADYDWEKKKKELSLEQQKLNSTSSVVLLDQNGQGQGGQNGGQFPGGERQGQTGKGRRRKNEKRRKHRKERDKKARQQSNSEQGYHHYSDPNHGWRNTLSIPILLGTQFTRYLMKVFTTRRLLQ